MSILKLHCDRLKLWLASLAVSGLSVGCSGVSTFGQAIDPNNAGPYAALASSEVRPATAVAEPITNIGSAILAVQEAQSPDEAVAAYSAGLSLDPANVALQEVYVRRLVDLNAPQVAEPAARRLAGSKPDSPLAWAVIAFAEAKRGNMVDALTDIALAARRLSDDPFVQRTAGEMLAWYDDARSRPPLAQGIAADLDAIHRSLAGQAAFSDAYGKADAFYKNPPSPNGAPAAPPTAIAGQNAPDVAAPAGSSVAPTESAPVPVYAAAPEYAAPAPASVYAYGDVYPEPAGLSSFVDPYATAYAPPNCGYYYPGCDLGFQPLYIGGDWGCYSGGEWHQHWDGLGRGYGYGRNYGGYAGNRGVRAGAYGGLGGYARGGLLQRTRSSGGLRAYSPALRNGSAGGRIGAATPRYAPRGSYGAARTSSAPRSYGIQRSFGGAAAGVRSRSPSFSGRSGGVSRGGGRSFRGGSGARGGGGGGGHGGGGHGGGGRR